MHVLTKQDPQRYDDDVIKLEVEQTTMNFLNLARQIDVFFLQKRFLLSALKPELLLTEENSDLKNELARKEELIKKHSDKIEQWKKLLNEQPKTMNTNISGPVPVGNPVGMPQHQMNPNMVGPGMQVRLDCKLFFFGPLLIHLVSSSLLQSPMHMQQMQMQQQVRIPPYPRHVLHSRSLSLLPSPP